MDVGFVPDVGVDGVRGTNGFLYRLCQIPQRWRRHCVSFMGRPRHSSSSMRTSLSFQTSPRCTLRAWWSSGHPSSAFGRSIGFRGKYHDAPPCPVLNSRDVPTNDVAMWPYEPVRGAISISLGRDDSGQNPDCITLKIYRVTFVCEPSELRKPETAVLYSPAEISTYRNASEP